MGRAWLPDTLYVNRYQDASYVPLASFQEDADLTTTTAPGGSIAGENLSVWHEGHIPWREGNRDYNGVFLGWNRAKGAPAATYTLTLPDGASAKWQLGGSSTVELSVAAMDEDASLPGKKTEEEKKKEGEEKKKQDKSKKKERESPDFTVELVASDGATVDLPVSRFIAIPPPSRRNSQSSQSSMKTDTKKIGSRSSRRCASRWRIFSRRVGRGDSSQGSSPPSGSNSTGHR